MSETRGQERLPCGCIPIADQRRLRDADRLADEVAVLVVNRVIDSRSAAADALLNYRNPPRSPRSDRLADLEADRDALVEAFAAVFGAEPRSRSKRIDEAAGDRR